MGQYKYDHPPLLAPGRHYLTLSEIEALCVFPFAGPSRTRREHLFYALEEFVQRYLVERLPCEIFLDGSFLTEKPEPDDVDVTVSIELSVALNFNPGQRKLVDATNGQVLVNSVDSIAMVRYPRGHPYFGSAGDLGNAGELYGLEHSREWLKGYVTLRVWETDVGNRICR
jgi:hypothetical protein